jgi:hypothetical protein
LLISVQPLEIQLSSEEGWEKTLTIPKGQSESVYRRRTDNTMAKRKKHKRTNNDLQWSTTHAHKTKDRVTRTPLKIGRVISPSHICVGRCFLFCPFSFGYCVVCCEFEPRSWRGLLFFCSWSLRFLSFFDLRIPITTLVSSNSSCVPVRN